jgi:hypothetical protein
VARTLALLSDECIWFEVFFGNIQSEYLVEFLKHFNENRMFSDESRSIEQVPN